MRGFAKAVGGWESRLEAWEREYLAGLLEQVAVLLAADDPGGRQDGGTTPPQPGLRQGESARDGDVLAALDFDPDPQEPPAPLPPTSAPPALGAAVQVQVRALSGDVGPARDRAANRVRIGTMYPPPND